MNISVGGKELTAEEIIDSVERICRSYKVEHLVLFGSYAKGTQTSTSDIDFALKGCDNIADLRERIALISTLKKIDVVDYDRCSNKLLKEDIDRYGHEIY